MLQKNAKTTTQRSHLTNPGSSLHFGPRLLVSGLSICTLTLLVFSCDYSTGDDEITPRRITLRRNYRVSFRIMFKCVLSDVYQLWVGKQAFTHSVSFSGGCVWANFLKGRHMKDFFEWMTTPLGPLEAKTLHAPCTNIGKFVF